MECVDKVWYAKAKPSLICKKKKSYIHLQWQLSHTNSWYNNLISCLRFKLTLSTFPDMQVKCPLLQGGCRQFIQRLRWAITKWALQPIYLSGNCHLFSVQLMSTIRRIIALFCLCALLNLVCNQRCRIRRTYLCVCVCIMLKNYFETNQKNCVSMLGRRETLLRPHWPLLCACGSFVLMCHDF